MANKYFRRQLSAVLVIIVSLVAVWAAQLTAPQGLGLLTQATQQQLFGDSTALAELEKIEVKGRAPKTGYSRKQFGDGWGKIDNCSVREVILARDLTDKQIDEKCRVQSGVLDDPYTAKSIKFQRGEKSSQAVQIDHVVALSDAWQKGAQQLNVEQRKQFANDPLNLLAVDGPANQAKGDGDAATWLPENKSFRCQYVARQVAIKRKYNLWMTEAEKSVISDLLKVCDVKANSK